MAFLWQPQWTTPVRIESGGRYPLGLNQFHDDLEKFLIKGVIDQANRLRYVTYCCWAIGDIKESEACDDYADFVDAFTRRENALALGLYMMKPDYGFYGRNTVSNIVNGENEYSCTFRLMQSNDLGAYGLYYAGTIHNWGLTEKNERGIVQLTQNGKKIYEIIEEYYQKKEPKYYTKYKGKKRVPAKVLKKWAQANDFDNIRKSAHKEEREFYKSVLFRLENNEAVDYRRDTFAFIMGCIKKCFITNTSFDEDVLRNIHYYSSYLDDNDTVRQFSVPRYFDDVHFYWSVYEGHVYFRWWLSKYFKVFMKYLKSCNNGSTIDEFFGKIDQDDFNATVSVFYGKHKNFFSGPMETLIKLFSPSCSLLDDISEESVTNDEECETVSEVLAKFVLLSAGLYARFKQVRSDNRYQYLVAHLSGDLWFETLFRFSDFKRMPVSEFLKKILKHHIIDQHDSIMIKKNDLRRCWFTTENNRYFYQADVSLIWRPAKFQTIINFLSDMNLIDKDGGKLKLSIEGRAFFLKLKRSYLRA